MPEFRRWLASRWARQWSSAMVAVTLVAGIAVVLSGWAAPGNAGVYAVGSAAVDRAGNAAAPGSWVTLITGDRVLVPPAGSKSSPTVDKGRRAGGSYATYQRGGDWYVVPGDAVAGLAADRLDEQLFNVSGLVRQGYDDASRNTLPVLVSYAKSTTARRVADAAEGARAGRELEGLHLVALEVERSRPERFWSMLNGDGSAKAALAEAGVEKVWLNARVRASLDQSTTQIGAPAAWQAGYSGAGVRIAILDTGIKADHPDFAGRIAEARDFSDSGSANDGYGHGTHVASIAAGSGTASGGVYKGVAPDATLLVGKVLDDFGWGYADDIIAGMEWAAGVAGADVVNMSLGGGPTDGTDPMSETVNELSKRYGTLFVVAAGNDPGEAVVSAPSVADSALSVASVGRTDGCSEFSSQGPRAVDGAVKPELAAPGEDIAAARAPGTMIGDFNPVDDHYARLSGTSMAAPHVAGAAAVLAQQHPDWTWAQLKAALTTTAADVDGTINCVGTGRLDMARATTQTVTASAGTLNAYLAWPHTGDGATQKLAISYRNAGSEPVALQLGLSLTGRDGAPAPTGLATLDAESVTIPASGEVQVFLTVAAQDGSNGLYQGILTATADGVRLRTAVAIHQEEERYNLSVKMLDRDGKTPQGESRGIATHTSVLGIDSGESFFVSGDGTLRLPPGRYALHSVIVTLRGDERPSWTMLSNPELNLAADTTVIMDARTAKAATLDVEQPAGRSHTRELTITYEDRKFIEGIYGETRFDPLYVGSTSHASSDILKYHEGDHLEEPLAEVFLKEPELELPVEFVNAPNPEGQWHLAAVYGGNGSPEQLTGLDLSGKLVVLELSTEEDDLALGERINAIAASGAAMIIFGSRIGRYGFSLDQATLPLPVLSCLDAGEECPQVARLFEVAQTATAEIDVTGRRNSRFTHDLYAEFDSIPADLARTVSTRELAKVVQRYHGDGRYWVSKTRTRAPDRPVQGPYERTEYFSPGDWGMYVDQYATAEMVTLKAGRTYRMDWLAPVFGPAVSGLAPGVDRPWVWQQDTRLDVFVPLLGDGAGHPALWWNRGTGYTELFQNGVSIGRTDAAGSGSFNLPAAKGTYRLVAEVSRDDAEFSTKVTCDWTIKLGNGEAPPVLAVGFRPDVDLSDTVPPDPEIKVPLTVTYQGGATGSAISSLGVEVSYDDGATWAQAKVVGSPGGGFVVLDRTTPGYASLRAHAADTAGNTVTQTVIRALRIG